MAVVDDEPYGGTCALRGCDPKKVLVGAAEVVGWQRRMHGYGLLGATEISWPDLMRFKESFTSEVSATREGRYREAGIVPLHGQAQFVANDRLLVDRHDLRSRHVLIAAGAAPRRLNIPGEQWLKTSAEFLGLSELPPRLALIGAGYIAFEFAHVAIRAGAQVTIVGRRALSRFEDTLVERLVEYTRTLGADVRLGAEVVGVERSGGALRIEFVQEGSRFDIETDVAIHAAGRVPNIAGLDLQRGGVQVDQRGGVDVNEYLQSVTNPLVYAAGDAVRPPEKLPLTSVAAHEGAIVASNLLHGNSKRPNYRGTPSVVFTVPPLASVGLTERAARELGTDVRVKAEDTSSWYSNRRTRLPTGAFKTLVDARTERLVGAHLLGEHADEAINLFALAIRLGLLVTDLKHALYAYPTVGSDLPSML